MIEERRVVVTGIGMLTASGSREKTWEDVRNGAGRIEKFNLSGRVFAGAHIKGENGNTCLKDIFKKSLEEAAADSGIENKLLSGEDVFSTISVSKPDFSAYLKNGSIAGIMNSGSVHEALNECGIACRQLSISAACSTGLYSIIKAFGLIKHGDAEICLAGSGETPFNELYFNGFKNMGVLAEGSENTCALMKPYDKNRNGFVLGEGGCVLVLEEYGRAEKRKAEVYAEITGGEMSFDPHGMFCFPPDSGCLAKVLERLFDSSGIESFDNIYVNSHGTATVSNDIMETNSFKKAFGKSAYDLKISSTKPVTGHLLGGSGAVGAAVAVMALKDQFVPPTANLAERDTECDLDYVPVKGYKYNLDYAAAVSMGFGGHIGAVAFKTAGKK